MTTIETIYQIPSPLLDESNPYKQELELAVQLALEAGKNIKKHCSKVGTKAGIESESSLGISTKSHHSDFATDIDILNEKIITNGIKQHFSSHVIIGEESTGTDKPATLTSDPTWIIDPIDGTTNFASGLPLTCVSIGYCQNRKPVLGVVYAPMTEELFLGVHQHGSYRNGVPICLSPLTKSKEMKDAIVLFELGSARSEKSIDEMLLAVKRVLMNTCRTTRSFGSGVLDLCYVATGRVDVIYTGISGEGWKPWDYCAAKVIVEEAGGCIRSLWNKNSLGESNEFDEDGNVIDGSDFDIYSDSMICGVHKGIVEECRRIVLDFK